MNKSKILVGFALLCCIMYAVFQFVETEKSLYLSDAFRALVIPIITILYFINVKDKSIYFSGFLILYSLSELMCWVSPTIPTMLDYYTGNALYISAYVLLVYEILKSMNFVYVLKHYSVHLVVLTALSTYIVTVLLKIVSPLVTGFEFMVEFVYNLITLLLLSVALINFIYRDSKKSLLMFFGALCIVFSEMIQIAYYYINTNKFVAELLNLSYTGLLIGSFCFFYFQSKFVEEEMEEDGIFVNS